MLTSNSAARMDSSVSITKGLTVKGFFSQGAHDCVLIHAQEPGGSPDTNPINGHVNDLILYPRLVSLFFVVCDKSFATAFTAVSPGTVRGTTKLDQIFSIAMNTTRLSDDSYRKFNTQQFSGTTCFWEPVAAMAAGASGYLSEVAALLSGIF